MGGGIPGFPHGLFSSLPSGKPAAGAELRRRRESNRATKNVPAIALGSRRARRLTPGRQINLRVEPIRHSLLFRAMAILAVAVSFTAVAFAADSYRIVHTYPHDPGA